jgi:hypothetical protein
MAFPRPAQAQLVSQTPKQAPAPVLEVARFPQQLKKVHILQMKLSFWVF